MSGMGRFITANEAAVRYAVDLAKKSSEALSFIPEPRLHEYARRGRLIVVTENAEPAGFCVFGVPPGGGAKIYQTCVQEDARRAELGAMLVRAVEEAVASQPQQALLASQVSLWCADDLDANEFWAAIGFDAVAERVGGARRGRRHRLWVKPVSHPLGAALGALEARAAA